jgi:hypothetical protein
MIYKVLSYCLMTILIISSFPIINTLQIPQKVMAQAPVDLDELHTRYGTPVSHNTIIYTFLGIAAFVGIVYVLSKKL